MGEIRPGNGGAPPPDDGGAAHSEGLPDLPPEWGTIIVPDDASALAEEAEAVRRELMLTETGRWPNRGRRRRRLRWNPTRLHWHPADSLAIPGVIIAVAALITLISLFVATWRPVGPTPTDTHPAATVPARGGAQPPAGTDAASGLGATRLVDPAGATVELRQLLPAVIIFVDGCDCSGLVMQVAAAAPPGVTVIAAGTTPPAIFGAPTNVRSLAVDRKSLLWTRYAARLSLPPTAAPAIIVDRSGSVAAVIPAAENASDVTPLDHL